MSLSSSCSSSFSESIVVPVNVQSLNRLCARVRHKLETHRRAQMRVSMDQLLELSADGGGRFRLSFGRSSGCSFVADRLADGITSETSDDDVLAELRNLARDKFLDRHIGILDEALLE